MRANAKWTGPCLIAVLVLTVAAPGEPRGPEQRATAMAKLHDRRGAEVGEVELRQGASGVHVHVRLFGLPAGAYVLSAHARGQCLPEFRAAGSELPRVRAVSLRAGGDGGAESDFETPAFAVGELKDWDGSSFLLSPAAARDQPLACGTVRQ